MEMMTLGVAHQIIALMLPTMAWHHKEQEELQAEFVKYMNGQTIAMFNGTTLYYQQDVNRFIQQMAKNY